MMIGPMKKKVITSVVVTAVVLFLIFAVVAYAFISQNNKRIAELEKKSEVVQRYVFLNDMTAGDVVTASDVVLVDVKGESAAVDSYIALGMIGRTLKVNANARTIVTESLFFNEEKTPGLDTRLQEFNMVTLPSDLDVGDYIDVRIRFATGEDYSVLIGKRVESFGANDSEANTIFLRLSEEEIVRMSSAIIESYIRDGVNLYANKYVEPDTQLFTYDRVNFVERYENAQYEIISGENSGDILNAELFVDGKRERTISEIAAIIGLNEEETENIKIALEENNSETLAYYKDKLVTGEKSIVENYPVKVEVATLIHNNPNLLNEIKAKYDIATLEAERIHFLDTNMTKIDEETGELVIKDEYIEKINEKLQQEITTQKTERQEYLLNLLASQSTATN